MESAQWPGAYRFEELWEDDPLWLGTDPVSSAAFS